MKVETHNHPTAISPFPGAATGSGGEIRDEGATGRGAKPKAGLTRLLGLEPADPGLRAAVGSDLIGKPERIASPLDIMIEGPLGAAAFNNEFGRPEPLRLLPHLRAATRRRRSMRGYHKPIMIAGGLGNIRAEHVDKARRARRVAAHRRARRARHAHRPGRRRGLVDGAPARTPPTSTSPPCSAATPRCSAARRRSSTAAGRSAPTNPILSIHDVGAGGLSNALPELVARRRPRRPHRPAQGRRTTSRACRRSRSGATRRRSATCWPSRPSALEPVRARSASASAARSRWSARPPATAQLDGPRPAVRQPRRSTCRSTGCSASRRG